MEEAWERAVETALEGADPSSSPPRTLTLDGVVKCLHGRMPPPALLERFQTLEHLSLANIGLASLEKFPKLRRLQRLILSDNRISGGLECLVEAGLGCLRDLDLSNNRIQFLEDLSPLAGLKLVSLDLYECPVTRIGDYRSKVFGLIRSLKYLDKMDAEENERPESDEEEEEEDEDDDEEDPGNGEVDGDGDERVMVNGIGNSGCGGDGVVDLYEDEESDADEEETDVNRSSGARDERRSNGFRVAVAGEELVEDEDAEDEEYVEDEDEDLGEEVDEDGGDEDVVEVHEIDDSEEDGVEEEDEDEDEEDVDEDDEDLEDVDEDLEPSCPGRLIGAEGEIDGHEQGEEDENGEIGEENGEAVEDERDYDVEDGQDEDEYESEYLVQPIRQPEGEASGSDLDAGSDEDDSEEEVDDEDNHVDTTLPSTSLNKRKRDDEDNDNNDGLNDDSVEDSRSSKHR